MSQRPFGAWSRLVVAAVDVDVLGHRRPEVENVVVVDLEAGGAELLDRRGDEAGVEGGDAVDHQR